MIARIWRGWTTAANAEAYEQLLLGTVVPGILARDIDGFREIQVLRHPLSGDEVEFTTIMWFDSLTAVKRFAGEDHERAVVPPAARALLARFDERSRHAEVRGRMEGARPDLR